MALAVLSKGLVGIVFPAAALVLHCLAAPRLRGRSRRLEWGCGLALFLAHRRALVRRWSRARTRSSPSSSSSTSTSSASSRPRTGARAVVVLPRRSSSSAFLPWMLALLPAVGGAAWKARRAGARLPLAALRAPVGRLRGRSSSASRARSCPPTSCRRSRRWRWCSGATSQRADRGALARCLAPVALAGRASRSRSAGAHRERARQRMDARALPRGAAAGSLAAAGVLLVAGLRSAARGCCAAARRWLALVVVGDGHAGLHRRALEDGYEELSPRQSGLEVAGDDARPLIGPDTRVYSVGIYDQTVPFYLGRTVTLVDYRDEFETGSGRARARSRPRRLRAEWRGPATRSL